MKDLYEKHLDKLNTTINEILKTYDHVVISSGHLDYYIYDDQSVPFRENPYFRYFIPGVLGPDHFVVFHKDGSNNLFFHQPQDYWHKVEQLDEDFWGHKWQIDIYRDKDKLLSHFKGWLKGRTAFIGPREMLDFELNPPKVLVAFNNSRLVKTDYEIEALRNANKIAVKGHLVAKKLFEDGASEYEIHCEYCKETQSTENELPYNNIIGLNENGAFLHYMQKNKVRVKSHSLLIDAGASYLGYHADITRTYVGDGIEFKNVLFQMEKLQNTIVSKVKSGVSFADLHDDCHKELAKVLRNTKIVNLSEEAIYNKKITDIFFPHGLGHSLGLQVHDVGAKTKAAPSRYPNLRMTKDLERHNVITIEPGIYFIKSLLDELRATEDRIHINWELISKLASYGGIRIEDDIVVLDEGFENLTRNAFNEAKSH